MLPLLQCKLLSLLVEIALELSLLAVAIRVGVTSRLLILQVGALSCASTMPLASPRPGPVWTLLQLSLGKFFRPCEMPPHLLELAKLVAEDASTDHGVQLADMELLNWE